MTAGYKSSFGSKRGKKKYGEQIDCISVFSIVNESSQHVESYFFFFFCASHTEANCVPCTWYVALIMYITYKKKENKAYKIRIAFNRKGLYDQPATGTVLSERDNLHRILKVKIKRVFVFWMLKLSFFCLYLSPFFFLLMATFGMTY